MGASIGDGIIVASLAAVFGAYLYFRNTARLRRLELLHQERLAAMDKGIPLPELPLDLPGGSRVRDPRLPLMHGLVLVSVGLGAMAMFWVGRMTFMIGPDYRMLWPLPLPIVFVGFGLVLFYLLASGRER